MGRRSDIQWHEIEVQYRIGAAAIGQIAKSFGIADSSLRARAKKEGWIREDGEAARIATREALASARRHQAAAIGAEIGAQQAQAEREAMEVAVLTSVEVVREHQRSARRGMEVAVRLLRRLELACAHAHITQAEVDAARVDEIARAALIEKQLGLRGLVESLDRWSSAHTKLSQAERDAHGLDEDHKPSAIDELLLRVAAERAEKEAACQLAS